MADLIKRLRDGLLSMGTSDDGEVDLYDIDDAYQVMDEAADALVEAQARVKELEAELRAERFRTKVLEEKIEKMREKADG